jgi:hypothetical protein
MKCKGCSSAFKTARWSKILSVWGCNVQAVWNSRIWLWRTYKNSIRGSSLIIKCFRRRTKSSASGWLHSKGRAGTYKGCSTREQGMMILSKFWSWWGLSRMEICWTRLNSRYRCIIPKWQMQSYSSKTLWGSMHPRSSKFKLWTRKLKVSCKASLLYCKRGAYTLRSHNCHSSTHRQSPFKWRLASTMPAEAFLSWKTESWPKRLSFSKTSWSNRYSSSRSRVKSASQSRRLSLTMMKITSRSGLKKRSHSHHRTNQPTARTFRTYRSN